MRTGYVRVDNRVVASVEKGIWLAVGSALLSYLERRFPINDSPSVGIIGVNELRAAAEALGGTAVIDSSLMSSVGKVY